MMPAFTDVHYTQTRHHWDDGRFSSISFLQFPGERFFFSEINQRDSNVKLSQIVYLRSIKAQTRGVTTPQILTFARLEQDQAITTCLPGVDPHTETGERLYSVNSLLTYTLRTLLSQGWLRYDGETWRADVPQHRPRWRDRARSVLALLTNDRRLLLGGALGHRISVTAEFEEFDVRRDLIPVDRLGFVREFVWQEGPRIAFNTSFFLLEHDDFFSHHSALGEAYNLCVRDGTILRPPLYRRAAIFQAADGRWQTGYFQMADLTVTLPDGTVLVPEGCGLTGSPFVLNPTEGVEIAIYTRGFGLRSRGRPRRLTPAEPGRVEYTIVDTRVVGRKTGGNLDIPQNGLVLSFASGASASHAIPKGALTRVRYGFVQEQNRGIRQAIQVGPMLLRNGQSVISAQSLIEEEFWPTPLGHTEPTDVGVVPTDYPEDVDRTRAGRIGLGVDAARQLVVVAVPGTERGTHRPDADSAGATLMELADFLMRAGAVDAVNLDGGGSTQLFFLGGLTTVPGNRYRMHGVQFERMVPSIGVSY
jgi:hypothetical protein